MTDVKHYIGHRQRVKEKVLKSSENTFADYELLEALLFLGQPRIDTKPLAKELLKKFPSFSEVFLAPPEELKTIKGVGDASVSTIKLVQIIAERLGKETLDTRFSVGNTDQIIRYCRLKLIDPKVEQFHVFFLDGHHQLITEKVHQKGTIDQTVVYPREIIKEALTAGATWLILAHNHPSGNCTPSDADIALTHHIMSAGEKLGIGVYDHFVFSGATYTSLRKKGLI